MVESCYLPQDSMRAYSKPAVILSILADRDGHSFLCDKPECRGFSLLSASRTGFWEEGITVSVLCLVHWMHCPSPQGVLWNDHSSTFRKSSMSILVRMWVNLHNGRQSTPAQGEGGVCTRCVPGRAETRLFPTSPVVSERQRQWPASYGDKMGTQGRGLSKGTSSGHLRFQLLILSREVNLKREHKQAPNSAQWYRCWSI